MKKKIISFISAILTLSMLTTVVTPALAAEEAELPIISLDDSRIDADKLPEGNLIYMGTASAAVEEKDALYSFPIYREGDLSEEASVDIHTLDLTAVYGKDYELLADDLEETGDGVSILEKYVTAEKEMSESENIAEDVSEPEPSGEENGEENFLQDEENTAQDEEILFEEINVEETDGADVSDDEKSLRQLKEEQTGLKTRDTDETSNLAAEQSPSAEDIQRLADELVPEAMANIEYSSASTVTFAPGENEKRISFRILDDNESEGGEGFSLLLVNPRGAELYEVTSLSVNIEDDEESEKSEISFSKSSYKSKDGKAVVTIKRKGAEYSLCDFSLLSSEDTAISGENYREVNESVAFMPYETEKEIEIPVTGEGEFKLLIKDLGGCAEGKYTEAVIKINEKDADENIMLMSEEENAFTLNIGGEERDIEYTMPDDKSKGASEGTIYAQGYDIPPEIGKYYFSTEQSKGGLFQYGFKEGDEPWGCGLWHSDYQMDAKISNMDIGSHYGRLDYYHTSIWQNGDVYTKSSAISATYYQYMVPDWESTSNYGGGQKARFKVGDKSADYYGEFGRSADKAAVKLIWDNGKPMSGDVNLEVHSVDDDGGRTPKTYVRFYGVAAMYKKYNIEVMPVPEKTYKYGKDTISAEPLQVYLNSGAEKVGTKSRDFWVNPDPDKSNVVFTIDNTIINNYNGKYGYVKGYTITIDPGTTADRTTLNYPEDFVTYLNDQKNKKINFPVKTPFTTNRISSRINKIYEQMNAENSAKIDEELKRVESSNLDTILLDEYMIKWIESAQKKVVDDGDGYYQNLKITPVVEYADVQVEVLPAIGDGTGYFTDGELAEGAAVTYHAGDTIDLSAATDEDDCHIVGYQVSDNGGIKYNTITDTSGLFLQPNKNYKIRPVVSKNANKIEIKFENGAEQYLTAQGLITEKDLEGSPDGSLVKELTGKYVLNAKPEASNLRDKITPVAGQVYTVSFISKEDGEYVYRPVITYENKTYSTNSFHVAAAAQTVNNVIKVGYKKVKKSDLVKFDVHGRISSANAPVMSNGLEVKKLPLAGYTVSAGKGTQSKNTAENSDYDYIADGVSAGSGEDGEYLLMEIYGLPEDYITVYASNGVTNGAVQRVQLNCAKGMVDGAYQVDGGSMDIAYPYGAPRVASVMYAYEKSNNNANADNTLNQIRILDDNLTLTAIVDKCGRNIEEVVFTVRTVTGETTSYTAKAENENSSIFTCVIPKMIEDLHSGDTLTVHIKDAEKLSLVSDGNTADVDIVYPEVDTGFTFYTANELTQPQTYGMDEVPTIDIPLIGSATGLGQSGLLRMGKTKWPDNTGYTLQVNADATFMGVATKTNKEKKEAYDRFHAAAKDAWHTKISAVYILNQFGACAPNHDDYSSDEEYEKDFAEYTQALNDAKNPMAGFNSKIMSVEAAFVLAFDFVKKPDGSYMFACGTVAIGGAFSFNKTMYSMVSNVPVFLNIQASAQANLVVSYTTENGKNALTAGEFDGYAGNIANRLESDAKVVLNIVVSGKVQVGAGLCGVLSARGYVSLTFQFDTSFTKDQVGALITAAGGVGFDLLILSINIDIVKYTKGWGTLATASEFDFFNGLEGFETGKASAAALQSANGSGDGEAVATEHTYSAGSADMSSFGANSGISLTAVPQAVNYSILQENAAERARPHIIPLGGDKKMITFIGNGTKLNSDRDEANAMTLFYSIYDGIAWSMPVPVADDGTIDSTPAMKKVGEKVIISWADMSSAVNDTEEPKDKLGKFGISCAVYDIESNEMGEEITLAEDVYMNLSPQINVSGDMLYVSYMKRGLRYAESSEDLIDFMRIYSSMAYVAYDMKEKKRGEETLIYIPHEEVMDPIVTDYHAAAATVGGESYMLSTYTVDADEIWQTSDDRELYLGIHNLTTDKTYFPIKITGDDTANATPKLTDIDGTVYLTWLNDGYMFNILNVSEILEAMFAPNPQGADEDGNSAALFDADAVKNAYKNGAVTTLGDTAKSDWYKKSASELGMDEEVYSDSVYSELANGEFRAVSANFQGNDDLRTGVGNYIVTSNGDDIYIYYTEFGQKQENTGLEIYGVRYKRGESGDSDDEDGNTEWGFGKAVQITEFDKVIDELDLYMTSDNKISAVSNFFSQWIDESDTVQPMKYSDNKLAEIDFEPVSSLEIAGNNIVLPSIIYPGSCEEITLNIENKGLLDAKGYTLKLKDNKGNEIYNSTVNETVKPGERVAVAVPWTVPDDVTDMEITAEVIESGVENVEISTATKAVPYETRLEVSDLSVVKGADGYYAAAKITNNGSKQSAEETATLSSANGKNEAVREFGKADIPALKGGETTEIKIPVTFAASDFGELGCIDFKLTASDGENTADGYTKFVSSEPMLVEINDGAKNVSLKGDNAETTLKVNAAPWNDYAGEVKFYSSDNGIAEVDDTGKVIATGNGNAKLYAYYPQYGLVGEIDVNVSGVTEQENPEPISIGSAEYRDGIISLPVTANANEIAESVNVYAAEYKDGVLVNLIVIRKKITASENIIFKFDKKYEKSELKLFVWDDRQMPYTESQTLS